MSFEAELQALAEDLRAATGASRATIRIADGQGNARLVAEARAAGVASMGDHPVPGVVDAPTYRYLAETGELLVQADLANDTVAPPASLIEVHDVRAQMLAPVILGGEMLATISVHEQGRARAWREVDIAALRRTQRELTSLLGGRSDA